MTTCMNDVPATRVNIPIPLTKEENARISRWAKRNGYLKGAMIRIAILRAVEEDESIRSGKTQIDMAALCGDRAEMQS